MLQITPAIADVLGPALEFTRRTQVGAKASNVDYERISLCEVRGDHSFLAVPAGLLSRVIKTLKSYNIAYTYEDLRPVMLGPPQWTAIDEPRDGQEVILAKVATCDMGQIEAPTGEGKTWIIVQVCKMYPDAPIVIVVPGIDIAKTVRDRLLLALPSTDVGQLGGARRERGRRVTICVKNSLLKADLDACKILFYDECHTAAGDKISRALTHAFSCKMFGFSASTEMRTDKADMLVEALFGPVIHVTTYQQSQRLGNIAPIRVIMRSITTGPTIASSYTSALNRHGLWRNRYRNQCIAEDAKKHSARGEQVLILVATVEHGLELMRFLGDAFTLVYAQMDAKLRLRYEKEGVIQPGAHPITQRDRFRLQEEFESGRLRRVISTCWTQGVSFDNLQVLIRADGLGSDIRSVQLPGRLSRMADGKEHGLLLDYMDEFHPTLHRRAQKRLCIYRKKGWSVQIPKRTGAGE